MKETLTEFQCENGHSQRETPKSVSMSNSAIHSKKVTVETNHKRHHNTLKIKKLQSNQILTFVSSVTVNRDKILKSG